ASRVRARRCTLSAKAASTALLRLPNRRRSTSSSTRWSNRRSSVRATLVFGIGGCSGYDESSYHRLHSRTVSSSCSRHPAAGVGGEFPIVLQTARNELAFL